MSVAARRAAAKRREIARMETLSIDEFAAVLGCTPEYVTRGIRAGRLPGYQTGPRDYRIPALAVKRFEAGTWRPPATIVKAPREIERES